MIAVRRHGAKIGQRAGIQAGQRPLFDQPLFKPADQVAAVDAHGGRRLAGLVAAVAVVAIGDGGLAGEVDAGRFDVRKADRLGAGHGAHLGLGRLADVEQDGVLPARRGRALRAASPSLRSRCRADCGCSA